jgi:hypothetical protein
MLGLLVLLLRLDNLKIPAAGYYKMEVDTEKINTKLLHK